MTKEHLVRKDKPVIVIRESHGARIRPLLKELGVFTDEGDRVAARGLPYGFLSNVMDERFYGVVDTPDKLIDEFVETQEELSKVYKRMRVLSNKLWANARPPTKEDFI